MITLCETRDVEDGTPISVHPEGFPPLAIYNIKGEYFVTDNLCTHGMANLSEGYQDEDEIECPFHGGAFSIKTGEALSPPCHTPIKTYDVSIVDGKVCIPPPSS
ncbi:MAG: non-heme iron oxygenase ferredoxin subunit [Cycloclasticus sp. symbiont of Poecilosclerida sp. M]|nr:MAG: non-heme iron oxygenase ferredoxin subunit [Cycloclasticus sp. symbiont of Poecilosclerida sp. M]